MLQLTPLSPFPHNCLLLTLDSLTILLNASSPDSRPPPNLPSQLDFIILSHSTPTHINALTRIALAHPHTQIYSTVPVSTLGRLSTLEATPSGPTVQDVKSEESEYEYLTPKDVDRVFDRITTVRYSQPVILSHGISVTAYPAGHSIGGTIWNIRKDQENIVVMVDWNHARERIVGGMLDAKTLRLLERASCVITDVRGSSVTQIPTRKVREQFFLDSITSALSSEQNVLIPVLPPTRALDLLMLLDNAFTTTPAIQHFPIFYLAHTSQKAISATRTMLEWLSQEINLQDHPFDFKFIKIVTQYQDLTQGPRVPRIVIVDNLELSTNSFAHQAFLDFKSSGNLLLLTSQSVPTNSITAKLLQRWETTSPSLSAETPRPIVSIQLSTDVEMESRIPLQGEDLLQWKRMDKANREQKDAELFFEERTRNLLEGTESDSEEDEEDQLILDSTDQTQLQLQSQQRIRGSAILLQEGTYDFWIADIPSARASLKHFPFVDKRKKIDDFGVAFKGDEFIRVEDEVVNVNKVVLETGGKRKWAEVETEVEEVPARVVKSTMNVDVNVRFGYVDLEGLHDGRAAGNLLPRLNARKIVVVNSSREDIDAFNLMWNDIPRVTREVYAPETDETIDISVDTRQYEISISDEIAKSIKWQTVQNQQIAHVIGSITPHQEQINGTPQPSTSTALVRALPTLSVLSNNTSSIPPARPLHVGEVRLLELKQRLQKAGYDAVLGEGVLVCDGVVKVSKEEGGRGVRIEGVITGEGSRKAYWDVRRAVYDGLAVV